MVTFVQLCRHQPMAAEHTLDVAEAAHLFYYPLVRKFGVLVCFGLATSSEQTQYIAALMVTM